ncbi:MAG: hypothetical protein A3F12_07630 [Gammaproteobacteria bacterium RIFCSPHIGHO2_12_FULL_38_14]|nr:MAG: hypothetical protein A3F12_07630 [Gammaproteobacteria bacterium RIFCSPHIGHO2_12_FULL_38_14]
MLMRFFVFVIILIAVAVGVFALVLPRDQLVRLIVFRDFFDVTLPILAFGALIKYLCTCCVNCKICHEKKE